MMQLNLPFHVALTCCLELRESSGFDTNLGRIGCLNFSSSVCIIALLSIIESFLLPV